MLITGPGAPPKRSSTRPPNGFIGFNNYRLYEYCGDISPAEMKPPTTLKVRDQPPAEVFNPGSLTTHPDNLSAAAEN